MALSAVLKVLKHGLVSADNPDAADAMHCIADAVTLCRFEATDPDHDDVVLSKILHVLLAGPATPQCSYYNSTHSSPPPPLSPPSKARYWTLTLYTASPS